MNLSEQIIVILDDIARRFGIVIDWTKDNVAPYLEDLVTRFIEYEVHTSFFWIILMASVALISWVIFVITRLAINDYEFHTFWCLVAIICTAFMIVVVGVQIYDIITCNVLPEKILLREIEELMVNVR